MTDRLERVACARLTGLGHDPSERTMVNPPGHSAMGPAWQDADNLIEARRFMLMFDAATMTEEEAVAAEGEPE